MKALESMLEKINMRKRSKTTGGAITHEVFLKYNEKGKDDQEVIDNSLKLKIKNFREILKSLK